MVRTLFILPMFLFFISPIACQDRSPHNLSTEQKIQGLEDCKKCYEAMMDYAFDAADLASKGDLLGKFKGKELEGLVQFGMASQVPDRAKSLRNKALLVIQLTPRWLAPEMKESIRNCFILAADAHLEQAEAADHYLIYMVTRDLGQFSLFSKKGRSFTEKMDQFYKKLPSVQNNFQKIIKSF